MMELEGNPDELRGLTVAVTGGDARELEILCLLLRAGASVRAYGPGRPGGPHSTRSAT